MRRFLPLFLLLSLAIPAGAQRRRAAAPGSPLQIPRIEQIAAAALERVPALSVAVRKGNAYYARAWGTIDLETNLAARTDSVFQIASVSKQFTAAAVLRLAEQGKLTVDDPLRRFIPELDARFDAITLRHLLNHTSGVADYLGQLDSATAAKTQQEILALIAGRPPAFPPGSMFQYSNSGYYLLGMVIERVSNRTYQQFLREEFLAPLQLHQTSYCGDDGPLPEGYGTDSRTGGFFEYAPFDMTLIYAAGGLCSTASDLLRWNRALTAGIALRPGSYAAMTGQTVEAFVGMRYGFGLFTTASGRRRIWHNGLIYGFQSHLSHYPDDDVTVVVLVNHYSFRDRATDIADQIAAAMFQ